MAVEMLLLNFDGPAGRKKGTVVNVQEGPEDKEFVWGKAERPPHFRIIRIDGIIKADLDPEWLEFGGHRSKVLVDDTKLTGNEKDSLDDPDRYRDKDGAKPKKDKVKITPLRLESVKKDNSIEWDAVFVDKSISR